MDKELEEKIEEKIKEALDNASEINHLAVSLDHKGNSQSFKYGLVVGRLYNSFYYQSRRILRRDPTSNEFVEFLKILKKNEKKILDSIS